MNEDTKRNKIKLNRGDVHIAKAIHFASGRRLRKTSVGTKGNKSFTNNMGIISSNLCKLTERNVALIKYKADHEHKQDQNNAHINIG